MKIVITIPSLRIPHGGTRIILTWAEYLDKYGHDVTVLVHKGEISCNWFNIPPTVKVANHHRVIKHCECLIISSPHSIRLQNYLRNDQKCFIFLQMMEHMFRPGDAAFYRLCVDFYQTPHPVIHGSVWNERELRTTFGRTGPTHYIGNGIKLEDFPISEKPKDGKYILVEGWECTNPAKDVDNIGPKVAARLKAEGFNILAYSQLPLTTMPDVPDEYYQLPSIEKMNDLYERATILIKASKYDARAVAPMEAMTKGTVTARVIVEGDDDLINGENCLRGDYREDVLYRMANSLLNTPSSREKIAYNCIKYVQTYTWDYWVKKLEGIITY